MGLGMAHNAWSAHPYSLHLEAHFLPLCPLLLSSHTGLLAALEYTRHNFSFASSQISGYLALFLSSNFYWEVTSSVKLPWSAYLKLHPTLPPNLVSSILLTFCKFSPLLLSQSDLYVCFFMYVFFVSLKLQESKSSLLFTAFSST